MHFGGSDQQFHFFYWTPISFQIRSITINFNNTINSKEIQNFLTLDFPPLIPRNLGLEILGGGGGGGGGSNLVIFVSLDILYLRLNFVVPSTSFVILRAGMRSRIAFTVSSLSMSIRSTFTCFILTKNKMIYIQLRTAIKKIL
jgi:hypothetical protein